MKLEKNEVSIKIDTKKLLNNIAKSCVVSFPEDGEPKRFIQAMSCATNVLETVGQNLIEMSKEPQYVHYFADKIGLEYDAPSLADFDDEDADKNDPEKALNDLKNELMKSGKLNDSEKDDIIEVVEGLMKIRAIANRAKKRNK